MFANRSKYGCLSKNCALLPRNTCVEIRTEKPARRSQWRFAHFFGIVQCQLPFELLRKPIKCVLNILIEGLEFPLGVIHLG